jgi:hypothetical protein
LQHKQGVDEEEETVPDPVADPPPSWRTPSSEEGDTVAEEPVEEGAEEEEDAIAERRSFEAQPAAGADPIADDAWEEENTVADEDELIIDDAVWDLVTEEEKDDDTFADPIAESPLGWQTPSFAVSDHIPEEEGDTIADEEEEGDAIVVEEEEPIAEWEGNTIADTNADTLKSTKWRILRDVHALRFTQDLGARTRTRCGTVEP